jgi:HEAT repeat protein
LPALVTILTNPVAPCRTCAAAQIAKFGTNALPALPVLIALLNDANPQVKSSAGVAIGDLALKPDISVPALINCLKHTKGFCR